MKVQDISGYVYESGGHNSSHDYILPRVLRLLDAVQPAARSPVWVKDCLRWVVVMAVLHPRSHHTDGT